MKDSPAVAAREARLIARAATSGALATFRRAKRNQGQPYVSKVGVALDSGGRPIFLFSTLAAHTQDLLADGRCSLLVEAPALGPNPLEAARATVVGVAQRLQGEEALSARETYLARHPGAARYVNFGDFAFWRLAVDKVQYVGGFGVARWVKAADYLVACDGWSSAPLLKDLIGPKKADLATALGGKRRGRAVDVDPDGVTFIDSKGRPHRLNFPSPAQNGRSWRSRFASYVKRAAQA
jgi:hypothetical protein